MRVGGDVQRQGLLIEGEADTAHRFQRHIGLAVDDLDRPRRLLESYGLQIFDFHEEVVIGGSLDEEVAFGLRIQVDPKDQSFALRGDGPGALVSPQPWKKGERQAPDTRH